MWRWQGLAAVILAVGITTTLVLFGIAGGFAHRNSPLSTEEASALTTVLGAAVGALAVFLGNRAGGGPPPPPPPPPEPPEPPAGEGDLPADLRRDRAARANARASDLRAR